MQRRGPPSAFVISQTAFDREGEIDWSMFRAHLRRLRESGIGVYAGGGGSGEGHTLLPHEVQELLAVAAKELVGKVPARAMGVEPRTARQMIEFCRLVKASGLDAMQIYSLDMGHLGQPGPGELDLYFSEVLDAIDLPSIISTHYSVGYMIPVDLLCSLCERYDSVIGINCSIGQDFTYLVRLLAELPPHVEVHVGGPMHTLSALAMGATGYLTSEANLAPKLAQSLVELYAKGDYAGAEEAYSKVVRIFSMAMAGLGGGKAMQNALGLPGGFPRRPRVDRSTPESIARCRQMLAEIGIPELGPYLQRTAS
ncbi:MAG TPA: dihydrodipicolinate synthase family protein [Acidimicrobiales bacterium]|nr:dihydrodipicolinate synthase family protein [Acidimicrobiales bacterium]